MYSLNVKQLALNQDSSNRGVLSSQSFPLISAAITNHPCTWKMEITIHHLNLHLQIAIAHHPHHHPRHQLFSSILMRNAVDEPHKICPDNPSRLLMEKSVASNMSNSDFLVHSFTMARVNALRIARSTSNTVESRQMDLKLNVARATILHHQLIRLIVKV